MRVLSRASKIVRIIHRTNAAGFKEESPYNLKPSKIVKDRITIYLDFNDKNISRDNLRKVYVFPDEISGSLPTFDGHLHKKKVDLRKVEEKFARFVFGNLEEMEDALKKDFSRIL